MLNGTLKVDIDGRPYTLKLDINAMADFESVAGRDAFDALEDLENGRMRVTDMRAMFWAVFQAHHPDVDLRMAGTLLTKAPDLLGKTVAAAMPKPKPDQEAAAGNGPAAMKSV